MYIKEKFEKSTRKDIILLYLIVIMFCSFVYIFYKDVLGMLYKKPQTQIVDKKQVLSNVLYTQKLSDVESMDYFNKNIQKYNVFLEEIKMSQNLIDIKVDGHFHNIINFLLEVSQYFIINQFEMSKKDNKINIALRLDREIAYIEKRKYPMTRQIKNPFILKKIENISKSSLIQITAIVDLEILVNNIWYKKFDMINEFKIIEIRKYDVLLFDTLKNKKLIKSVHYE